jgi:hypothetical protein
MGTGHSTLCTVLRFNDEILRQVTLKIRCVLVLLQQSEIALFSSGVLPVSVTDILYTEYCIVYAAFGCIQATLGDVSAKYE